MSKYFVTTSIFYSNAPPHVGHAMELVSADVLARFHRARGYEVMLSTGTDEHGGKNAEAAAKLGVTPKQHVDNLSQSFKDLCVQFDISQDRFIRTTDKQHQIGVTAIWKKLLPYIYKNEYIGMYDQREEDFITLEKAREIKKKDPERYERLQEIKEENYFFALSKFNNQIKKVIEDGSLRIVPISRRHEILSVINQGLEDISISRPKSKISWGIPVPGDSEHTIYVWFEALMNYITVLGYPDGDDFNRFWPADVQVIGKDILRFHAAIWPAMLLALEINLPKNLYVHGHITLDGKKMSKSVGNVVSPVKMVDDYGSDAVRYYLLRHIPSYDDGDFSWFKMEQAHNGELGNELGNLVQRMASMINLYQDGAIGEIPPSEHDSGPLEEHMQNFRFDRALDYIFGLIKGINQYIDEEKPWVVAKSDAKHLEEILSYAVGSILQIGFMLSPFMPKTSQRIEEIFASGVVSNFEGSLFPKKELHTGSDKKD